MRPSGEDRVLTDDASGLDRPPAAPQRPERADDQDATQAARLDVRLVPISAGQIEALESLERALRGLAEDFRHDLGVEEDQTIAGGLYRLWSTLEAIRALWYAQAGEGERVSER